MIALASIVGAGAMYPLLGFTWLPDFDAGEFDVSFRAAPGSRVEYTTAKGHEVAALVRQMPEVQFTYLTVGGGASAAARTTARWMCGCRTSATGRGASRRSRPLRRSSRR
jgi:HAE1 family hydrophobic/amphiphilic exporter-1